MRPTGKLHLGHWVGALSNWVSLQEEHECFFMVADWHALMSEYKSADRIKEIIFDNVCDWILWGIDPTKATIFVQSEVSQHLELFMILGLFTPLGMLSRCPTFKEQLRQLRDRDINTYSFLGYPLLQAADIILYNADAVPVGEDQLPHLELTREIIRRFHHLYNTDVFIEPQPLLTSVPRLLGLDGRKMSKSYNNYIALDEDDDTIRRKILSMITDPQRIKLNDPGHPEICNVFTCYEVFRPEMKKEVYDWCSNALKGCKECKKILAEVVIEFIKPKRKAKEKLFQDKEYIYSILRKGRDKAEAVAQETLKRVKKAMGLL